LKDGREERKEERKAERELEIEIENKKQRRFALKRQMYSRYRRIDAE